MENRIKTLLVDIDGTLTKHQGDATGVLKRESILLPGVLEQFNSWSKKGYKIVLTTARKESMREETEKQLRFHNLFWDVLLMGIGMGERIVINDITNPKSPRAVAINVTRDEGFKDLNKLYTESKIKMGAPDQEYEI